MSCSASIPFDAKNAASNTPKVKRSPRCTVRTLTTSRAIGSAIWSGHVSKTRCTAVSAKASAPRKLASVVAKIRNGNSAIKALIAR